MVCDNRVSQAVSVAQKENPLQCRSNRAVPMNSPPHSWTTVSSKSHSQKSMGELLFRRRAAKILVVDDNQDGAVLEGRRAGSGHEQAVWAAGTSGARVVAPCWAER